MKAFLHRVECHDDNGKFLGAAEFKTFKRPRAERAIRLDLTSRLYTVMRNPEAYNLTFKLSEKVDIEK